MAKFKAGDKVVRTGDSLAGIVKGGVYTVNNCTFYDISFKELGQTTFDPELFELYQEPQQFNLKTNKWWIATPTPEISKAVQEWLFEQGVTWCSGETSVDCVHHKCLVNFYDEDRASPERGFMHNSGSYESNFPEYEIKITTKTVIDSVTFPNVISEQEKARKQSIAELEATIAKAQEQIEQLKGL